MPAHPTQPDDPVTTPGALSPPPSEQWPHASVLVVDDEPGMRHFLDKALAPRVGRVMSAGSAEEAHVLLRRHRFELIVLDITLPGDSGITLLRQLREQGNHCEVVLITAFADLQTAIDALRAGASDFLLKPFRMTQIINAVQRGLERGRLQRENWVLKRTLLSQRTPPADGLVGQSIVIKGLRSALQRVAGVGSTVLLTGESGTGKELAALALHAFSPHASAPFVPVNCATMSPALIEGDLFGHAGGHGPGQVGERRQRDGLFVYAQGGTLFLDEIGELPLALQATVLRVLEDRHIRPVGSEHEIPIDVRIVAATNRPLIDDVQAGRFRKDLYYRLQVVEITLPPLRAHKEDIPDLVAHFVATLAPRLGVQPIEVSAAEMGYLQQYDWPGNVRELRNLVERSLIVGALNVSALYQGMARSERADRPEREPGGVKSGVPANVPAVAPTGTNAVDGPTDLQTLEKRHIITILESVDGDKTRAAQLLGISRRTLERRCAEWGDDGSTRAGPRA